MSLLKRQSFSYDKSGDTFRNELHKSGTKIPMNVAKSAMAGASFNTIEVEFSDRVFTMAGNVNTSITVEQSEEFVNAEYFVLDEKEEEGFFVEEQVEILPAVKQVFSRGDFWERDADFVYVLGDEEITAQEAANPVDRLEEEKVISHMSKVQNDFPSKWMCKTENGELLVIRCRSGSIKVFPYETGRTGELYFHAYVGRDHPGTYLYEEEILNIVSSVEYISFVDEPKELPDEDLKRYWTDFADVFDDSKDTDLEELYDDNQNL